VAFGELPAALPGAGSGLCGCVGRRPGLIAAISASVRRAAGRHRHPDHPLHAEFPENRTLVVRRAPAGGARRSAAGSNDRRPRLTLCSSPPPGLRRVLADAAPFLVPLSSGLCGASPVPCWPVRVWELLGRGRNGFNWPRHCPWPPPQTCCRDSWPHPGKIYLSKRRIHTKILGLAAFAWVAGKLAVRAPGFSPSLLVFRFRPIRVGSAQHPLTVLFQFPCLWWRL